MGSNAKIKVAGNVGKFEVRKTDKDGGLKNIVTKLYVTSPDFSQMCTLAKDPDSAEAALIAAKEGGCKIEIPHREEEFIVRWMASEKKITASSSGAAIRKITYDQNKDEAVIEFGEPYERDMGIFYLDNIGVQCFVVFEVMQKELELETE